MSEKINLMMPIITDEMEDEAVRVLSEEMLVMGESVYRFEEEFAKFVGVDHAISTSSGTNALSLIWEGLEVTKEVITTPATFIASANSILNAGAKPIFSDIKRKNSYLDPKKLIKVLTDKTNAILPVHLYGGVDHMDEIQEFSEKNNLYLIEDACQAHGATYKGQNAGSFGDAAAFSFYSTKNMTVGGDGGMVTTNNDKLAKKISQMRDCGRTSKYVHTMKGYTARLNTISAAIGRIQLKNLKAWNSRRNEIAQTYNSKFKDVNDLELTEWAKESDPVYHIYSIRTKNRDQLAKKLSVEGIQTGIHYPLPVHLQPLYKKLFGYKDGLFPISEEWAATNLSLPMHPLLTSSDVNRVIDSITNFFEA